MKRIRYQSLLLISFLVCPLLASSIPAIDRNSKLEFIGSVLLEPSPGFPVLGVSSIRYDEQQDRFILLSDDTGIGQNVFGRFGKARYYEASASAAVSLLESALEQQGGQSLGKQNVSEVTLKVDTAPYGKLNYLWQVFSPWTWINDGHVDTEGVALINQSELLIASEQGGTYPIDRSRMQAYWDVYNLFAWPEMSVESTFLQVDRDSGKLLRRHHLPHYYHASGRSNSAGSGIQSNKGVESVDLIPGTDEFIAITEAPLHQDVAPWKKAWPRYAKVAPSRLIHFSLDKKSKTGRADVVVERELLYGISSLPRDITFHHDVVETGVRSGVSDLLALDKDRLLVLERHYVRYKKDRNRPNLSVARIYLVDHALDSEHEVTRRPTLTVEDMREKALLGKDILFDSLALEGEDVFRTLNIEGLTFGPSVAGRSTLVLVNDNDAATTEPTRLLFFAVSNPE